MIWYVSVYACTCVTQRKAFSALLSLSWGLTTPHFPTILRIPGSYRHSARIACPLEMYSVSVVICEMG